MVRLPIQFASDWKPLDEQATGCEPTGPVNHRGPQWPLQWRRRSCYHASDMQPCCEVCQATGLHTCRPPLSYAR